MTKFLSRLFDLERREREVAARELAVLQAETNVLASAALLREQWDNLERCAQRIDQIIGDAKSDEQKRRCEFTADDAVRARSLGVIL
jgi:hypothetical protein